MFDKENENEKSLNDLFETDDGEPLDEFDTDSSEDSTETDSETPAWAESLVNDNDDVDESTAETPATETSTSESEATIVEQTEATPSSENTVDLTNTGTGESEDTSLTPTSLSNLPSLPFSLGDEPDNKTDTDRLSEQDSDLLATVLSYIRSAIRGIFYVIMSPVVFVIAFFTTLGGLILVKVLPVVSILVIADIWVNNTFSMSPSMQWKASVFLLILAIVCFYIGVYAEEKWDI